MLSVTSILLITKARHQQAESTARRIGRWVEAQGVACVSLSADAPVDTMLQYARKTGAVLVLGGDGTFVGVCRKLAGLDIPVLGINFGQVGFLAVLSAGEWEPYLASLLKGTMPVRPRLVLVWAIIRGGRTIGKGYAINDVVVGRGAIARVLPLRVSINGEALGRVRSDGIIVSTPVGSSAYALSAHGALVHPDVQALSITPISPFFKSFPPMVVPPQSVIALETEKASSEAFLTVDGQEGFPLIGGDTVRVRSADGGLRVFIPEGTSYFQRLQERGFIQSAEPVSSPDGKQGQGNS